MGDPLTRRFPISIFFHNQHLFLQKVFHRSFRFVVAPVIVSESREGELNVNRLYPDEMKIYDFSGLSRILH